MSCISCQKAIKEEKICKQCFSDKTITVSLSVLKTKYKLEEKDLVIHKLQKFSTKKGQYWTIEKGETLVALAYVAADAANYDTEIFTVTECSGDPPALPVPDINYP